MTVLFANDFDKNLVYQSRKDNSLKESDMLVIGIAISELADCFGQNMSSEEQYKYAINITKMFDEFSKYEIIYAFRQFIRGEYKVYQNSFNFILISMIFIEYRKEYQEYKRRFPDPSTNVW